MQYASSESSHSDDESKNIQKRQVRKTTAAQRTGTHIAIIYRVLSRRFCRYCRPNQMYLRVIFLAAT